MLFSRSRIVMPLTVMALVVVAAAVVTVAIQFTGGGAAPPAVADPTDDPTDPASPTQPTTDSPSPSPTPDPTPTFDPSDTSGSTLAGHGLAWGVVDGVTMFRGNPTRSWYGIGPVPAAPEHLWMYPPTGRLCSISNDGGGPREWCGTGWTGQPVVWRRPDGIVEMIVGAYDRQVHFLDVATGQPTRPAFPTGDLIKGSVTLDPDGYPLLYVGSRDNYYRVIALDRDRPTELWRMEPHPQRVWNNDWDGNGAIVDGLLIIGGEDSWFRVVELNRTVDADGMVQVDPEVLAEQPGFDDELFRDVGDRNVSIEGSPLVIDDMVYVANSGGLVSGFDISRVREGEMPRVFRYWLGDDTDATLVAGPDGIIYAAVELERFLPRAREVGQLVALDPSRPDDPRLWGVDVPPRRSGEDGGMWATPAIHGDFLYVPTHPGELLVVHRHTGEVTHREQIGYHEWSSPLVVDDILVLGLCTNAAIQAWDLGDPARPIGLWTVSAPTGGCFESTPTIFEGRILVGSRDGRIHAFGDR